MRRILAALLLSLGAVVLPSVAVLPAMPAHADTSDFTFDSFDADYTLTRDADGTSRLEVVETIVARFPDFDQNRGIIRAIPDDYDGVPLSTTIRAITDQNGVSVPFETTRYNGFIELALGTDEFVRGVQTYVISYQQINVVRSFADTGSDEFYWDVNGVGWDQPFGTVAATLHVDPTLADTLTGAVACYAGAQGAVTPCDSVVQSDATILANASTLAPRETLTLAVGFAATTFVTPDPVSKPLLFSGPPRVTPIWLHFLSGGLGLLGLGGVVGSILASVRARRGSPSRGAIIAEYSEPVGIDILQSAHLVNRASAALPAAIVRLAVRRNLRILAYAVETGGAPYTLQFLSVEGADATDASLLRTIFGRTPEPGDTRPFGPTDRILMTGLTAISAAARASIVTAGLLARPPGGIWAVPGIVMQFVLGCATIVVVVVSVLFSVASPLILLSMTGLFFGFFIVAIAAYRPQVVTERGAPYRDFLFGMRMYLTLAEQDRLRMLQSPTGAERIDVGNNLELVKLYEKLLPWAVLWGVEDQWMRELAVHVDALPERPDWFLGANGFDPAAFRSVVFGLSTAISPPPSTSGRSSWGGSSGGSFRGGSSGGGFSGGGGGGGGGGGR